MGATSTLTLGGVEDARRDSGAGGADPLGDPERGHRDVSNSLAWPRPKVLHSTTAR